MHSAMSEHTRSTRCGQGKRVICEVSVLMITPWILWLVAGGCLLLVFMLYPRAPLKSSNDLKPESAWCEASVLP